MSINTLQKKEKNWWYITYRPNDYKGQKINIPFHGHFEEALQVEKTLRRKPATTIPTVCPTLIDIVQGHLSFYQLEYSAISYELIRSKLYSRVLPFFGKLRPQELTSDIIETYKRTRLDDVKPRTINIGLSALSGLIKYGVERDYCEPLTFKIRAFSQKKTTAP